MDQKITDLINKVDSAISLTNRGMTKLTQKQFDILGMASTKNRVLLNNLVDQNTRYLEIGNWLGSTFVAALYGNPYEYAIAIDNFSEFGRDSNLKHIGTNYDICPDEKTFRNNVENNGIVKYTFINADCFNLTSEQKEIIKDINVYFYDGGHTEDDQRKAITYYLDCMQDIFLLIVDDWNHPPAKTGTALGIKETNLAIHKEWHLNTPENRDSTSWWNGVYLAVCEKPKREIKI